MAITTEGVRRRTTFDPDANAAKPLKHGAAAHLPLAYFGQAVNALDADLAPAPLTPEQARFKEFHKAILTLAGPDAQRMMDYLEWRVDGNTQAENGRFGTRGMELLSQLTPQSDHWGWIQQPMTPEHKQTIIDAAKFALTQNYPGGLLSEVHGGDGLFEPSDLTDWLARNPDQDGLIGNFKQGQVGDCSLVAAILAISRTPHGQKIIQDAIRRNPDGSWQVTFKQADVYGQTSYRVTQAMLNNNANSTGDLDVRILEEAVRKRDQTIEISTPGWRFIELFTGETTASKTPEASEDFAELVEAKSKGAAMVFGTEMLSFDWKARGLVPGHVFTIESFDTARGLVYYRNPWDTSKLESTPIANLLNTKVTWAFLDGIPSQ